MSDEEQQLDSSFNSEFDEEEEERLLESPFRWNIKEELSINYDEDKKISVTIDDQPAIVVMESLTKVYCSAMKGDYEKAKQKIVELHELRLKVDESRLLSEKISIEMFDHVIWSTVYDVHKLAGDTVAAEMAFEQIPELLDSRIDRATIRGCRAIVSMCFLEENPWGAIADAHEATIVCADSSLWQFLYFKCLRRMSMVLTPGRKQPRNDQKKAIFECTRIFAHPFYHVYQAQMYVDCGKFELAQFIYEKAYKAEPESAKILLKLVDGFVKLRKLEIAKVCLDKLENRYPDNPMLLHHKGLYSCALKEYEEAVYFFEAAAASGIYAADIQFVACKMKTDKNFDHIEYLREMLDKYNDPSKKQNVLLHLAVQYRNAYEFSKSCKCFFEAIQIDRRSYRLTNFQNKLSSKNKKILNIFDYVKKFIPECKKSVDSELLEKLQECCKDAYSTK